MKTLFLGKKNTAQIQVGKNDNETAAVNFTQTEKG